MYITSTPSDKHSSEPHGDTICKTLQILMQILVSETIKKQKDMHEDVDSIHTYLTSMAE